MSNHNRVTIYHCRATYTVGFERADGSVWVTTREFKGGEAAALAWATRLAANHGVRPICALESTNID